MKKQPPPTTKIAFRTATRLASKIPMMKSKMLVNEFGHRPLMNDAYQTQNKLITHAPSSCRSSNLYRSKSHQCPHTASSMQKEIIPHAATTPILKMYACTQCMLEFHIASSTQKVIHWKIYPADPCVTPGKKHSCCFLRHSNRMQV